MTTGSRNYVVVDASFAVKWLIAEEFSDVALALAQSWADAGAKLAAPHLMPYEVSNALHKKVVAGDMTVEIAAQLLQNLMVYGVELYEASDLNAAAFQLATRFNQRAIYDSHYLALAQALDCEFWTADERFYRSASPNLANIRLISEAAPNR